MQSSLKLGYSAWARVLIRGRWGKWRYKPKGILLLYGEAAYLCEMQRLLRRGETHAPQFIYLGYGEIQYRVRRRTGGR